jgi:AraC-like DNA-binding protein
MLLYTDKNISINYSLEDSPEQLQDLSSNAHAHKNHEILYFIQGKCNFMVEGRNYKLTPGGIVIARSGEVHTINVVGKAPYERIVINFSDEFLNAFDPEHQLLEPFLNRPLGVGNYFNSNSLKNGMIYEIFRNLKNLPTEDKFKKISVDSNIFALLCEIKSANIKRGLRLPKNETFPATEIISYINANLVSNLSLEFLANKFLISKNHLNRIFKASTGMTVWEYIKLKRLMLSREYLSEGVPAINACELSGFKDYSSYYRAYKKQFGTSPRVNFSSRKGE